MKTRTWLVCGLLLGVPLILAACSKPANDIVATNLHEIPTPAKEYSAQANLAAGAKGELYLSWMETEDDGSSVLRFSNKTDSGWSEPTTVVRDPELLVNYADFPSLLVLENNVIAAHWMSNVPENEGYNVNIALSHDGGKTWGNPIVPHHDGTPTEHGFVSMAPDPSGGIAIVWFDSRNLALEEPSDNVSMRYENISLDGVAGPENVVDERVCECCQTSMAVVPGGLIAAYRNRTDKEIRDTAVTKFDGKKWSEPKIVFADNWEINACPINGPALVADGSNVAVAWFTAPNDKPKVQIAFSKDGGETFGQPFQVDEGNPLGRLDAVMLSDGRTLVSWLEKTDKGAEVRARAIDPAGASTPPITIGATSAGTGSGFPRMKQTSSSVVFAWTDTEQNRVRTSELKLGN